MRPPESLVIPTQFGRVELDPMRVPRAAAMATGRRESFAARLDAATAGTPEPERARSPARVDEPAGAGAAEPPPAAAASVPDVGPREPEDAAEPTALGSAPPRNALPERAEAEPRAGAAQTPPAPRSVRSPHNVFAVLARVAQEAGAAVAAAPAPALLAGAPAGAPVTTRAIADRIGAPAALPAQRPAAATVAVAGYRTLNRQSVQMVEQARDSVFRQIVFRLGKDTGEMRVRLEPPELGELDLHLRVDRGGSLRLSIGAERAELRDLLLQDLDQLKRTLQDHGLRVVHAEVHLRDGGRNPARGEHDRSGRGPAGEAIDPIDDAEPAQARPVVWTAQGLDFWV